jgi:hypothetical protein
MDDSHHGIGANFHHHHDDHDLGADMSYHHYMFGTVKEHDEFGYPAGFPQHVDPQTVLSPRLPHALVIPSASDFPVDTSGFHSQLHADAEDKEHHIDNEDRASTACDVSECCNSCSDCDEEDICLDEACARSASPCSDAACLDQHMSCDESFHAPLAHDQHHHFGADESFAFVGSAISMTPDPNPHHYPTDLSMGIEPTLEFQRFFNHVLGHVDPNLLIYPCGGSCPADDINNPFPFETCMAPRYNFVDEPVSQPLCGANIPNMGAFVQHIYEEHKDAARTLGRRKVQPPALTTILNYPPVLDPGSDSKRREPSMLQTPSLIDEYVENGAVSLERPESAQSSGTISLQNSGFLGGMTATPPTSEASGLTVDVDALYLCKWKQDGATSMCGQRFRSEEDLHNHVKTNHLDHCSRTEVGFECKWDSCQRDKPFNQKSKLDRHMNTHTGCRSLSYEALARMCDIHLRLPNAYVPLSQAITMSYLPCISLRKAVA